MKNLLGCREKRTWRAAPVVLAVAWIVMAASVPTASAQGGPGLRAGFSASPDQFYFGGHYVTPPIWHALRFQPNVEAGFGDDRTVVAFNMEFGYWMSVSPDWQAYVSGGPAMNIAGSSGKGGDDVGPGLTVGVGLRRRGGLFFEMKVGAFDSPDFKLAVGYTFR
ncbi:MAG: hypothetical protein R6V57_03810 [Vicinamibacterales bacterium]